MIKQAHIMVLLILGIAGMSFISVQDVYQDIAQQLKSNNTTGLSKHFDNSVEITIESQEGTYSKSQAAVVVKNFLDKNKPQGFEFKHKGASGTNDKYAIGILKTSSKNYRTFISLKQSGSNYLIQEIRFEVD